MKTLKIMVAALVAAATLTGCSGSGGSDAKLDFISGKDGDNFMCYFPDRIEEAIDMKARYDRRTVVYPCVNGYYVSLQTDGWLWEGKEDVELYKYAPDSKSELIARGFSRIGYVNNGLVPAVEEEGPVVVLDTKGEKVFTAGPVDGVQVAEVASVFSDGLLWFRLRDNREGYFDTKGNAVILLAPSLTVSHLPAATFGRNFSNGIVVVNGTGCCYVLNSKGELGAPVKLEPGMVANRIKKCIIIEPEDYAQPAIAAYDFDGKRNDKLLEKYNKAKELSNTDPKSGADSDVIDFSNEMIAPFNFGWVCKKMAEEQNPQFINAVAMTTAMFNITLEPEGDAPEKESESESATTAAAQDESAAAEVPAAAPAKDFSSRATVALQGAVKSVKKGVYVDEYNSDGELTRRTAHGNVFDKRTYTSPTTYKDYEGDVTVTITDNVRKEAGPNNYERATYTFDSMGRIVKAQYIRDMEYVTDNYTYDGDSRLPSTITSEGGMWNSVEKYTYLETDKAGNWTKAKVTTTVTSEPNEMDDTPGGTRTNTETVTRTITYWN